MSSILRVALRRLRERRAQTALYGLSIALGALIVGSSSIVAALFHERSIGVRLAELPADARSLRAEYRTEPGIDARGVEVIVDNALDRFGRLAPRRQKTRVWDPIAPADERGVRLVEFDDPARAIAVVAGRRPAGCRAGVCEGLALSPGGRVGARIALARNLELRIVGRGVVLPDAVPETVSFRGRLVAVPPVQPALHFLLRKTRSTVVTTATVDPTQVHGYELDALRERLRVALVRVRRAAETVSFSVPLAPLDRLAREGEVASSRLLLVGGQGAALVLVFSAFVAALRSRDSRLFRRQLRTLAASDRQLRTVRAAEAFAPAALGVTVALLVLLVSAGAVAAWEGLSQDFIRAALPQDLLLAMLALALAGALVVFFATDLPARRRFGVGALELAAATALVVVIWQAASTGALDPGDLAAGSRASPVILLLPSLTLLAAGVLLLRLLPAAFRVAERGARRAPFPARLALLGAARSANAAAATTFLAVALGSALFSLSYRTTLIDHTEDAAAFEAGAEWRVVERGQFGSSDVSPLTRYANVSRELPAPVLRLDGVLRQTGRNESETDVTVLGLPADRLEQIRGWRMGFADLSLEAIGRALRPRARGLSGPTFPAESRRLRVWVRAATDVPRALEARLLLPGDAFTSVPLGETRARWSRLEAELPAGTDGAQLVGLSLPPASTSPGIGEFDEGTVDLGPIEVRTDGRWSVLTQFERWIASPVTGRAGFLIPTPFFDAPVARGVRLGLNGTASPFIRPHLALPQHPPALLGPGVSAVAVDGLVDVDVLGRRLRVRATATSELFPTVLESPRRFVIFDYTALFSALNVDQPGVAPPSEAWYFSKQKEDFGEDLRRPPFRTERAIELARLRKSLRDEPLAAGAALVLALAAFVGAALAVAGLLLAARSDLANEQSQLTEYEALGASPTTLIQSALLRSALLVVAGVLAAAIGSLAAVRLVAALVAVTAAARRPLPPIQAEVAWRASALLLILAGAVTLWGLRRLTRSTLRLSRGERLRA